MRFQLSINQIVHDVDVEPDTPLLWVLRDHLAMTGTKYGCGMAQCGACTVYMDGQPVRACVMPAQALVGKSITTIEGLNSPTGRAVQQAWQELNVVQCGFCQSGQIMAAAALLEKNKSPTDADIDQAMSGNICRCATYVRIRSGIHLAARKMLSSNGEEEALA